MTKAEVERYLEGGLWRLKTQAQFDYSLANLFGISVARVMDNKVSFPKIEEVYPELFREIVVPEEKQEEIQTNNSMNNFLAFAMKHNARMKEGVELKDNGT